MNFPTARRARACPSEPTKNPGLRGASALRGEKGREDPGHKSGGRGHEDKYGSARYQFVNHACTRADDGEQARQCADGELFYPLERHEGKLIDLLSGSLSLGFCGTPRAGAEEIQVGGARAPRGFRIDIRDINGRRMHYMCAREFIIMRS